MASFEQHINGAVISSGIIIAPLHLSSIVDVSQSLILLSLGMVGGVLPDLDSDSSKPIQIVFKMISIFLPLVVILLLSHNLPLIYMIAYWLVSTLFLRLTLFKFFVSFTKHRGIFHSIPMGIFLAQITMWIFYKIFHFNIEFSTIAGSFLLFGFIVHLLLDEFVSLNALGIKVKNSFGSAFKFYDLQNPLATVLLYIFIVTFFIFFPLKTEIFIKIFNVLSGIKLY